MADSDCSVIDLVCRVSSHPAPGYYGRDLVNAILVQAKQPVRVKTQADNFRAIRCYEKCGMQRTAAEMVLVRTF